MNATINALQAHANLMNSTLNKILEAKKSIAEMEKIQEDAISIFSKEFVKNFDASVLLNKFYAYGRPGKIQPLECSSMPITEDYSIFAKNSSTLKISPFIDYLEVVNFETLKQIVGYYGDSLAELPVSQNDLYLLLASINADFSSSNNRENFYEYRVIAL